MDSTSLTTASVDKTCRAHMNIFVLVRAISYATLFIGLVLVYVPGLLLGSARARTALFGVPQIVGMIITAASINSQPSTLNYPVACLFVSDAANLRAEPQKTDPA